MWMVDPAIMCRKHLLGEHVELHMLIGTIKKGVSIRGYVEKGLVEPFHIHLRHSQLVEEMEKRGYKHLSMIENPVDLIKLGSKELNAVVDREESLKELLRRCSECRDNYRLKYGVIDNG